MLREICYLSIQEDTAGAVQVGAGGKWTVNGAAWRAAAQTPEST